MGFRFESAQDPNLKVSYYRLDSSGWSKSSRPYNDITTVDAAVAEGDYVPYVAADSLNRLVRNNNLRFGTSSTQYLANNGTWQDIPDASGKLDAPSIAGTVGQVLTSDGNGGQTWEDPTGGVYVGDTTPTDPTVNVWVDTDGDPDPVVTDVQLPDGTSIVNSQGVGEIPTASVSNAGVVKYSGNGYNGIYDMGGIISTNPAYDTDIKTGTQGYRPITPVRQHAAAFYGLAKAAGADMKDITGATVGVYPEAQKSAIHEMLSGSITISGTTPTINALPGLCYICGECLTLTVNLPASGCVDVQFESGSTPTVLTVVPASGQTVKWANGFDPDTLDADTTYEINIADGLGVAGSWT